MIFSDQRRFELFPQGVFELDIPTLKTVYLPMQEGINNMGCITLEDCGEHKIADGVMNNIQYYKTIEEVMCSLTYTTN